VLIAQTTETGNMMIMVVMGVLIVAPTLVMVALVLLTRRESEKSKED
jgi:heme/copper-type cytochrome/quinol oxidase subunit 2